jgi:hypothetical protein
MTPEQWVGVVVALTTIFAAHAGLVKFLTKHYLYELKPNGGSSLKDKVNHLEQKVDLLTDIVKEALRK